MPPATINLCEIKQLREKTTGKTTTCPEVEVHELPCVNVCPNCSVDLFKLEKRFQVIERYVSSPSVKCRFVEWLGFCSGWVEDDGCKEGMNERMKLTKDFCCRLCEAGYKEFVSF